MRPSDADPFHASTSRAWTPLVGTIHKRSAYTVPRGIGTHTMTIRQRVTSASAAVTVLTLVVAAISTQALLEVRTTTDHLSHNYAYNVDLTLSLERTRTPSTCTERWAP